MRIRRQDGGDLYGNATILALTSLTFAFVSLTVLVASGAAQPVDGVLGELVRHDTEWTRAQARGDILVEGLQPTVAAALLALTGKATSARRRSWSPLCITTGAGVTGAPVTLAVKVVGARPDTAGALTGWGGSYPSGRVPSAVIAVGGLSLALDSVLRWSHGGLMLLVGDAMGYALLLLSVHWFSDVASGLLLGVVVATVRAWLTLPASRLQDPRSPAGTPAAAMEASGCA